MQNYELFLRFHHKLAVFLFYFTNFDFIESTSALTPKVVSVALRTENLKYIWFFSHLFVPLHPE